jgi:hypothetical protein
VPWPSTVVLRAPDGSTTETTRESWQSNAMAKALAKKLMAAKQRKAGASTPGPMPSDVSAVGEKAPPPDPGPAGDPVTTKVRFLLEKGSARVTDEQSGGVVAIERARPTDAPDMRWLRVAADGRLTQASRSLRAWW